MQINMFTKSVISVVLLMGVGIGISACDRAEENEEPAKISDSSMEESIDDAIDDTQEVMSDSWITTKVKSELMADDFSKGFDVNVHTENGVVTLEGTLQNQSAVDHISELAAGVKGVSRVDASNLRVQADE